ncbi:unnamed protein product [Echinostoma caproni]|uniref:Integron gene cassette protein n=1 Tax=Echinostoma caproni TaxID=27848 RepID=A0A183AHD8_9TREM|nr:unnamed protein product [Echinostoma caproni]
MQSEDNQGTLVYRIITLMPSTTDMWDETKLFLAELIAHVCQQPPDRDESFHLSSIFLQSDELTCFTTVNPVNGAVEVKWADSESGPGAICSVLFEHSLSGLDVIERQLFGAIDEHWRFAVSIQFTASSETPPDAPRFNITKVAQIQNSHVHVCDDRGVVCSQGIPLAALI